MVTFVPGVTYRICLALPAEFTQPGDHLLAQPCTIFGIVRESPIWARRDQQGQRDPQPTWGGVGGRRRSGDIDAKQIRRIQRGDRSKELARQLGDRLESRQGSGAFPPSLRTGSLGNIPGVREKCVGAGAARERRGWPISRTHSICHSPSLPPLTANSNGVKFSAKASGVVRH